MNTKHFKQKMSGWSKSRDGDSWAGRDGHLPESKENMHSAPPPLVSHTDCWGDRMEMFLNNAAHQDITLKLLYCHERLVLVRM